MWKFGGLIAVAGFLFAVLGPLVVAGQILLWLRSGTWLELEARLLWGGDPNWSWLGLQRVAEWVGHQSLAAVVFLIGAAVGLMGLKVMEEAD